MVDHLIIRSRRRHRIITGCHKILSSLRVPIVPHILHWVTRGKLLIRRLRIGEAYLIIRSWVPCIMVRGGVSWGIWVALIGIVRCIVDLVHLIDLRLDLGYRACGEPVRQGVHVLVAAGEMFEGDQADVDLRRIFKVLVASGQLY